ncbi:hypothetical protein gvb01_02055 [Gardnerella vaginalis]|nr:DUF3017 domain-containing protein [Gardnerella vaginalis]RDX00331.1 hypothetical protein gvb01_02055 [Gardnerella vaginalis]
MTISQKNQDSELKFDYKDELMQDANSNANSNSSNHIYVSEVKEGKPYAQWIVAIIVCVCAVLAFIGKIMAATVIISATAIILGIIRLIFSQRSPWKVRSIAFDSFISIALGLGLLITYFSIFVFM